MRRPGQPKHAKLVYSEKLQKLLTRLVPRQVFRFGTPVANA